MNECRQLPDAQQQTCFDRSPEDYQKYHQQLDELKKQLKADCDVCLVLPMYYCQNRHELINSSLQVYATALELVFSIP